MFPGEGVYDFEVFFALIPVLSNSKMSDISNKQTKSLVLNQML